MRNLVSFALLLSVMPLSNIAFAVNEKEVNEIEVPVRLLRVSEEGTKNGKTITSVSVQLVDPGCINERDIRLNVEMTTKGQEIRIVRDAKDTCKRDYQVIGMRLWTDSLNLNQPIFLASPLLVTPK
jgi:hypothetical protein